MGRTRWLFAAALLIPFASIGQDLESTFRAGQADLQQGQFAQAAQEFKKVLQLEPGLLEAEVNLGLAYQGLLNYNEATRYLVKALHERSNLLGPNVIVGMDYLKLGFPEKGVSFLQAALKLDPTNRDAMEALATSYLEQDNFAGAAGEFRQIAESDPDKAEASFKLGHEYLDLAARLAYRGAHLYPESPWGHRFLGDLLSERARWQEAIAEYQKALAIAPHQPGLHTAVANAYRQEQKIAEADAELKNEQPTDHVASLETRKHLSDSEWLALGKARLELHQYSQAADALSQVRGVSPENEEASYWLERTYQALGAAAYAQLEETLPDSWRAHQLRAESHALRGEENDSVQEFQAALAQRPQEPELHEALAELYLENHDYDAARRELEQTLSADPSRTHALYLLGRVYVETRDNEKAIPYLERALRIQPDLAEANSLLGTAYLRLGQASNAVPKLEKAASSDHYGGVHYQLFMAYRKLGQTERAQKELLLSQNLRKSHLERDQAMIMGAGLLDNEPQ